MLMAFDDIENLFSYGTLQSEAVQLATFGRRLEGKADRLIGYRVSMIPISARKCHRHIRFAEVSLAAHVPWELLL